MDTSVNTTGQRKRATNRLSKGSPTDTTMEPPVQPKENTDAAALSITPIPAIIPVSECRRSSRKKIIKFDVRDLLNKNRKPHKIQIEARIDSNVPSTSKSSSTVGGETVSISSGSTASALGDLSSKQKTFMEKSAIFRRFSISQEQTKPPPPPIPMPPTMLSKVGDNNDPTNCADLSGKRINRTQEFYSNVMLKPKQTTSLIVAQMESSARSVEVKRKSFNKAVGGCAAKSADNQEIQIMPPQQKRRGRPPKARQQESAPADVANAESKTNETSLKLTPEKATNWKEYKACLAQKSDVDDVTIDEATLSKDTEELSGLPKESISELEFKSQKLLIDDKDCLDLQQIGQIDVIESEQIESQKQSDNNEILELQEKHVIQSEYIGANTEICLHGDYKDNEVNKQGVASSQLENLQECPLSSADIAIEDIEVDRCTPATTDLIVPVETKETSHSEKEAASITCDLSLQTDSEKEITPTTHEENTSETSKEISITSCRSSSISKLEISEPSSLSRVVPAEENTLSKDVVSPRFSPVNKDEEKKTPAAKRSKRLQRKNIRAEYKETLCKNIEECFEKIQPEEKENPPHPNNNSKQPEGLCATVNECAPVTEGPIQYNFGAIIENEEIPTVTKQEQGENLNSESSSTSEKPQQLLENVDNKSNNVEQQTPQELNKNEPISKLKEDVDEQGDSTKQPSHELNKIEVTDCQTTPTSELKENIGEKSNSAELPLQELESTDCQRTSTYKSIENLDENLDSVSLLVLELDKNDSNESQQTASTSTSKSKVKVSTIQRKSLRNRKENNKFDIECDEQVLTEHTNEKDIVCEKEENIQIFEEVQHVETKGHEIQCELPEGNNKEVELSFPSVDVKQSSGCIEDGALSIETTVVCEVEVESVHDSSPTRFDDKDQGSEQESSTTAVYKSKPSTEKPTSAKRKSLRIQKECSHEIDENERQPISVEIENVITQTEEDIIPPSILVMGELIEVPKRKPRKSRFKNLHGPEDAESEMADKSVIRQEELKEIEVSNTSESKQRGETNLDDKTECQSETEKTSESHTTHNEKNENKIEESAESLEKINKNDDVKVFSGDIVEHINIAEQTTSSENMPSTSQTESTNSYVIKNVSIETNTLLDILRTVQSNKEAAQVEAQKSFDPVPELHDSGAVTASGQHDPEVLSNKSPENPTKDMKLKKLIDNSNYNSPNRSDSLSPLTLKKAQNSPCRSDSSSPLTLKKVNISPSRSETSSPLTFNKKVTRRYERRSRRGDDESTHNKTLEETFAEIAALSSKAVLEMTITTETDIIDGTTADICNKGNDSELTIDENKEITEEIVKAMVDSDIKRDNENEAQEFIEVTPTRKTRQPKTRSSKVQSPMGNSETREIAEHIIQDSCKEPEVESVAILVQNELMEPVAMTDETTPRNEEPIVATPAIKGQSTEMCVERESCKPPTIDNKDETRVDLPAKMTILKPSKSIVEAKLLTASDELSSDDKCQTQIISSPKVEEVARAPELAAKKREPTHETSKSTQDEEHIQEVTDEILLDDNSQANIIAADKIEEGAHTPKQVSKKRDSSLPKSEPKVSNRKSTKKLKNPENNETAKTEDSAIKMSTTPPKRGRKAKTTQQEPPIASANSSGGKKKTNKEQPCTNKEEEEDESIRKDLESDSAEKSLDEKIAKKKRQRKLKEAFEAALNDKPVELNEIDTLTPSTSPTFGLSYLNKSPPPITSEATSSISSTGEAPVVTAAVEPEEDPDPLKDIEKFIEDGVNLLKKGYKIDEDSVDNVIPQPKNKEELPETEIKLSIPVELSNKEVIYNTFETPADTPLTTPSVTPPPKSPDSAATICEEQTSGGVRRSHRIKLITKMPKALVGRGLVRDKERFSIKDDVETKSHYTLDDHLLDLAEVEAKNAKFLKEMEERLSNFHVIKENEYKCERVISKEARKMICDCFLTAEEEGRGELACGEDCLNRLLMIECGTECNVKERCTNKRFQKFLCSPCRVFRTEKKGFGIMADIEILPGEFIMEYVGEVIDTNEFERRRIAYSQEKNRHYYFMALRSDAIIDATIKGNISRFINHSCDPNAETQKWTVNGELRIGFFSRKSIMPGEEITFDYQYQRYGREAQRCYCESANCRGWIGQEPNSDEGEQIDDDDESDDEEDEEDTSNLLEEDDEDSDASVSDPEEVQKKLEMAAAQAQAELAPITLDEKDIEKEEITKEKEQQESIKPGAEEDSKSKFKKLLSKMAEKVAAKHKQNKREQKLQRKKKSKESSSDLTNKQRSLEDPDIEDEVEFLSRCGLKTQSDTLRLSRLMVRAKLVQTRLNLLDILRKGELPCRRLFLDYHGLRLVHGWMSEDAGNMQIRLALLQTLELLPIANKTVLTDSKVMQVVRNWCGSTAALSPNDDSLSSNSNSQDGTLQPITSDNHDQENPECVELQKLALKLITTWDGLPEIFRIPKKERIEQMKEHEREADRQYAETEGDRYSTDGYRTNRFGRRFNTTTSRFAKPHNSKQLQQQNNGNTMRTPNVTPENTKCLSKTQRREMFAAKVARDEAEKRMAEERREFETKCRFFGLDPKKTRPQDVPFCVNPATGQWYSVERKPITTPPSYAHVQVPVKPKSTNPVDYQLPAVCSALPPQWKFAITPMGQIYYYHVQYRVPQWDPPSPAQLQLCEINNDDGDSGNEHTPTTGPDSSDDDDEILIGMDAAQLKAYIDRKVEMRRQKRYQRLVDERAISPRREEDRIYNQLEVRKYKENKEKIRKRKEEIRRKRAEAFRQSSLNMCTLGSLTDSIAASSVKVETEIETGVLPIQDYLLSSDEDEDIKAEVNSPLIDKIVEGDKIVDELDALTTKRPLKRPLPPHRDLNEPSPSSSSSASVACISALSAIERQEYKKRKLEKKDKRKPKEQDAKYRRTKEKFRCEIAGIIVHHLKPYRKDICGVGRIKSNDDFNHLARKLTHFVMIKELKYCESVGQTLVVTESVKNKSREFIKKYMAKYGEVYVKPANDPEFKDIPFTL